MAMLKVIEVLAESETSWEDAAEQAVAQASATLRNVKSIYIKHMEAAVEDGEIVGYRINAKISFLLEEDEDEEEENGEEEEDDEDEDEEEEDEDGRRSSERRSRKKG